MSVCPPCLQVPTKSWIWKRQYHSQRLSQVSSEAQLLRLLLTKQKGPVNGHGSSGGDLIPVAMNQAPAMRNWRPSLENVRIARRSSTGNKKVDPNVVGECPMGYPRLAALLASDRSFMQYRGFGALHSRILLAQQYDIEALEKELDKVDRWEKEGDEKKLWSKRCDDRQSCREDMPATFPRNIKLTRPEILTALKHKLMEYGE